MKSGLSEEGVDFLIEDANRHTRFDAPNFVDSLVGSRWNLPNSEFGWRRAAQEWGKVRGLVEEGNGYIILSRRGEDFRAACHQRGITIFAKEGTRPE